MDKVTMGASIYGTCLQGEIEIPYDRLVEVFGKHDGKNNGYKVDAEWDGIIDGLVFTIYNYKNGKNYLGDEGLEVEEITNWHIGGKSIKVVDKLKKYISNFPAKEKIIG